MININKLQDEEMLQIKKSGGDLVFTLRDGNGAYIDSFEIPRKQTFTKELNTIFEYKIDEIRSQEIDA